jgi:phosphotransferase system enzyme I (PtsI)
MHPAHLLDVKQRVLQSDVGVILPLVERMKRVDDPERMAALLERLNA